MKKKTLLILLSVILVCALGLVLSLIIRWPVSSDSTDGNVGKSSRFSRKTATERIDNMEELLQADENYKNSIVLAYSVMQTRAMQFAALVDMSNQVAGDIPEFEGVLKDMNEAAPMVRNVVESLSAAGTDLNTVLKGESCPDVTQSTINASLAYTTLQKQNELANRFIETTDKYIKKADASDELLLVRDQWVDYQQMTAALEGDTKAAKELKKKGTLLPSEKVASALSYFDLSYEIPVLMGANLSKSLDVSSSVVNALPSEMVNKITNVLVKAAEGTETAIQSMENPTLGLLLPVDVHGLFRKIVTEELSETYNDNTLGARPKIDRGSLIVDENIRTDDLSDKFDPRKFYHTGTLEAAQLNLGAHTDIEEMRMRVITDVVPGLNHAILLPNLGEVIELTSQGFEVRGL